MISDRDDRFTIHLADSSLGMRLTADQVVETVGAPMTGVHAYFCGPASMRDALKAGLRARGLRRSAFHHEAFEFRTGIGLRRLAAWLLSLLRSSRVADACATVRSEAG